MTSSLEYFNIFKDKLFWTNFAMKLTTFQTFNAERFVDSHSKSLKNNFYGVFGKEMCGQFHAARYRTKTQGLEPGIIVETA